MPVATAQPVLEQKARVAGGAREQIRFFEAFFFQTNQMFIILPDPNPLRLIR